MKIRFHLTKVLNPCCHQAFMALLNWVKPAARQSHRSMTRFN